VRGIEGTNGRVTAEAEWKRTFITDAGLVITPLLHVQGDGTFVDQTQLSIDSIDEMAFNQGVAADIRSEYFRYMATAGLEARWPVLFSTASATHVLEPVGQIFARPDERYAETLGIPNEDAQSAAFDATSLFDRDKFSGYDRIEGGTRANLRLRYTGTFSNGWTAHALGGQSYHLAGLNSMRRGSGQCRSLFGIRIRPLRLCRPGRAREPAVASMVPSADVSMRKASRCAAWRPGSATQPSRSRFKPNTRLSNRSRFMVSTATARKCPLAHPSDSARTGASSGQAPTTSIRIC
jgi:lipopolysaccharide assembly outer membrane protein LptD (OstA)